jgi:methyltransferase (TIGR00027 family)
LLAARRYNVGRLPWPKDTRVFEVDLPGVLAFKDGVLAAQDAVPGCIWTTVPADLRTNWAAALTEAGYDRTGPAAWLAEGLLIYLPPAKPNGCWPTSARGPRRAASSPSSTAPWPPQP